MDSAVAPDTDGQLRFPSLGIFLLYAVAGCLLLTFPILGTGLASVDPDVLRPQSWLFAIMVTGRGGKQSWC